ncbi:phosphatidylinositol 3,4,5-trisphosphate 5-phosphatase 2-like isoform X2 [Littorina saxatilis]|uniref:phosphatidylinositol-3,4,5-trisphosphate 5-phosphatase n=1 Tax=Littorina saxatilis TaxID=31220 RepID=A0AAN9APA1_9CAEN
MPTSSFFHKGISRLRSEELLLLSGEDGSFLVRDSESVSNAYVLCVLYQLRVHQYRILPDKDGRLSVQSEGDMQPMSFSDLPSLIQVYINKGSKNGLICPLRRPVGPERSEVQEPDSEDEEDEAVSRGGAASEDDKGMGKNLKYGLLHNFARLDLSACDGEFVEGLKSYIDSGLDKDATRMRGGHNDMPELQSLLQVAGRGLQSEVDTFLLKLAMVQDILATDDDDRQRTPGASIEMTGTSYVSFLAAKLQQCKSQLLEVQTKAEEVIDNAKEDPYDYPEEEEVLALARLDIQTPCLTLRGPSVRIPLSTFEVKLLKAGKVLNQAAKLNLNVDMRQGRLFAVKPSKDFLDSSNTFTHDKILQLVKNTKDNSRLDVVMEGKKKFTYQFDSAHERENFCLQVRQMKMLHSQETEVDNLSIFIGSWNMGKSTPTNTLKFWLRCWGEGKSKDRTLSRLPHDMYVIGTQESGMADKDWINTLKATLKATLMVDVELLETCTLWGLRLAILILPRHRNKISVIQKSSVRTGIANALGNKGAVAISFLFNGTSLCFINAHLTSGEERMERRHANFRDILKGLSLGPKNLEAYDVTHKFHHVFFFGDLNYRVEDSIQNVLMKAEQRDLRYLIDRDQLRRAQSEKKSFFAFNESEIMFMPTYRLERHTPGYKYDWRKVKKTGERINVPSWCDRILWTSFPGTFLENSAYGSVDNLLNSDHRPVFGSFVLGVTSQFVQNRASLSDNSTVTLVFKTIEAQIQTSFKQCYLLEFTSPCLPDIIYCEPNKAFGDWQKSGMCSNPLWDFDELPQLRPMFGDQGYLDDQHILIAVKGAGDDHESFGECILALKGMFDTTDYQDFEFSLTHHGEETGKLRGSWFIRCSDRSRMGRSRKTYEVIALDTEYHDPEEIHALSPWLHQVNSSPQLPVTPPEPVPTRAGTVIIHADEEVAAISASRPQAPIPEHDMQRLANGKTASPPPPIPNKRARPMMGQSGLAQSQRQVIPVTVSVGCTTPTSSPGAQAVAGSSHVLPMSSDPGPQDSPPPIPRKLKPGTPNVPVVTKADPVPRTYEDLTKPKTVQEWLSSMGLTEYLPLFLRIGCDTMASVHNLTAAQVMKMGIRHPEHRTRLLQSVHELAKLTEYHNT